MKPASKTGSFTRGRLCLEDGDLVSFNARVTACAHLLRGIAAHLVCALVTCLHRRLVLPERDGQCLSRCPVDEQNPAAVAVDRLQLGKGRVLEGRDVDLGDRKLVLGSSVQSSPARAVSNR